MLFLVWTIIVLISTYVLAYLSVLSYPPSFKDNKFVQSCGELNGKDFTLENIQTLHGMCYKGATINGLTVCTQDRVDEYLKSNTQSSNPARLHISEGGLFTSWRCMLEPLNGKIKAIPFFADD